MVANFHERTDQLFFQTEFLVFNRAQRPSGDCNVGRLVGTIYFISWKVNVLDFICTEKDVTKDNIFRRHLALQSLDKFDDDEDSLRKFYRNSKHEVSSAEWAICEHSQEYCALAVSCFVLQLHRYRANELFLCGARQVN